MPELLPGTWESAEVHLVFSTDGRNWRVHGWGVCHPEWCDWGETDVALMAPSVESKAYTHAFAEWRHGFATAYAVIKLEQAGLAVELYTVFHDQSGRSDFRHFTFLTWKKK
jgi:hypothetical protein